MKKEVLVYNSILDRSTGSAIFSKDHKYRYVLTRKWSKEGICLFIMLNPSTADEYKLDPTVNRAYKIAKRYKLGELVVLNVFAIKGTDPSIIKFCSEPVGEYNDYYIKYYLKKSKMTVLAWGNNGKFNDRATAVKKLIINSKIDPFCIDINNSGEPKHPLYTKNNAKLKKYKLDK
jgi:hypothetical protein